MQTEDGFVVIEVVPKQRPRLISVCRRYSGGGVVFFGSGEGVVGVVDGDFSREGGPDICG